MFMGHFLVSTLVPASCCHVAISLPCDITLNTSYHFPVLATSVDISLFIPGPVFCSTSGMHLAWNGLSRDRIAVGYTTVVGKALASVPPS